MLVQPRMVRYEPDELEVLILINLDSVIEREKAAVDEIIAGLDEVDWIPVNVQLLIISDGEKELITADREDSDVVDSNSEDTERERDSKEHPSSVREEL